MRFALRALTLAALSACGIAHATDFSPKFSDYAFPGTQFGVDAPANAYFAQNYGITIQNAYLYRDSRDTFDGIGIANGPVPVPNSVETARVTFLDLTDFVNIEYLAIQATTYSAFNSGGTLLGQHNVNGGTGVLNFNGGADTIAYLTFTGQAGFGTISGLRYNYDGVTGGGNTHLPSAIPEPETYALMLGGLGVLAFVARRRRAD